MKMIMSFGFFFIVLLLFPSHALSQKRLQITYTRFGHLKRFELFIADPIAYKLKGEKGFRKGMIANLQDSLIIFTNDEVISLSRIRCIRFKKIFFFEKGLKHYLLTGAIVFPLITTLNNALRNNPPYLREGSVIVSASLVTIYLISRRLQIKRIRITKNKTLEIRDVNYGKLNQK